MINYTNILREHNLKATPQRLTIANILYKQGHITIENLYEMMIKKFHSISLATIYKNINLMVENSFIKEVKIPHAKSVYELKRESHSHLACEKCGEIEDMVIDLDAVVENALSNNTFKVISSELVLSGICKNCQ